MQVTPALPWDSTVEGGTIQLRDPLSLQQLLNGALDVVFKDGHAELNEGSFTVYPSDNKLYVGANNLDYVISNVDTSSSSAQYSELILERTASADETLYSVTQGTPLPDWNGEQDCIVALTQMTPIFLNNFAVYITKVDDSFKLQFATWYGHSSGAGPAYIKCSEFGVINYENSSLDPNYSGSIILAKMQELYPSLNFEFINTSKSFNDLPASGDYKV